MDRTTEQPLVRFKIRGRRAEISLDERARSLEELNHIRTATFATLRKDRFIPNKLLDLIEHYKERTAVSLFYRRVPGPALTPEINFKPDPKKPDIVERLAELFAARERMRSSEQKSLTASEALAFFLRIILLELKYEEKKRTAAPARTLRLVPRSVIAEAAMDLLGSCALWNYSPGDQLIELIRELLNIEGNKHGLTRNVEAQEQAAFIVAQVPTIPTRELARLVHVDPGTMSRWRKTSEFAAIVRHAAQAIAHLKADGTWDKKIREFQEQAKAFPGEISQQREDAKTPATGQCGHPRDKTIFLHLRRNVPSQKK